METTQNECCPEFHPEKWDEQSYTWDNKKFIKESIPTFFHIPLPLMIDKKVTKMHALAEKAGALAENKDDILLLFHDPSAFRSELFLGVTKDVPGIDNVTISGNFEAKVFDGPYNEMPKFFKQMDSYLDGKGAKAQNYFVHYGYCPKCAKKFGHNYLVLFAKV